MARQAAFFFLLPVISWFDGCFRISSRRAASGLPVPGKEGKGAGSGRICYPCQRILMKSRTRTMMMIGLMMRLASLRTMPDPM